MKFNRLEIEAFMAIGHATVNLDSKGLVLIQGENLDDSSQNSNGSGKCLPLNTILQHAETGERDTLENWKDRFEAGESIVLWGLDPDLKLRPTNVTDVFHTGEKNILRLHFDDGSYQDVSETHPVVSQLGEVRAQDVSVGDSLQSPRHLKALMPHDGISESDAIIFAGLIAEGSMTGKTYSFTNQDSEVIEWMNDALAERNMYLNDKEPEKRPNLQWILKSKINKQSEERKRLILRLVELCRDYGFDCGRNWLRIEKGLTAFEFSKVIEMSIESGNPEFAEIAYQLYPHEALRRECIDYDIHGKLSIEKHIPDDFFRMSDSALKKFIQMFWACDGYVSDNRSGCGGHEISVTLGSKRLIDDLQVLLLRFGISTRVAFREVKAEKKYNAWNLTPYGRDSTLRLIDLLRDMPIERKRNRLANIELKLLSLRPNDNRDLIPAYVGEKMIRQAVAETGLALTSAPRKRSWNQIANHDTSRNYAYEMAEYFNYEPLRQLAMSDVKWLKVVKIESIGQQATMDISVDNETHLYALDHIITHNSTIVEALQWALYGETARGDKGDAIVHRQLKKNTRVLVQVVDGDREYNVVRHRKHKDHKNRLLLLDVTDREDIVDMTLGTDKATQELVEKVIGCSAEVFRAAVYSGQEQQIDLPALTDKALKVIVEEAAGIDKMQQAYIIARKKLGEASEIVTEIENQLVRKQDALTRCNEQIEALKAKQGSWDDDQQAKMIALKQTLVALSRDVKEQKAVLDTFNVPELTLQLDKVKSDIAEIDGERLREKELEKEVTQYASGLSEATRIYNQLKQSAVDLKIKLSQVESEIGSNCSECGQLIKESTIADRANMLKLQITQKVNEAKRQRAIVDEVKESLSKAHDALKAFKLTMTDITDLVDAQSALQAQINAADKQASTVRSMLDSVKREKARLDAMGEELNPYAELLTVESDKLTDVEKQIVTTESKLGEAKYGRTIAGSVVDVFSPAGIRAHILDTVTPFLNNRTAQYLGTLSDGNIQAEWSTQTRTAKGDLREKFGIEVKSSTGGESYRSLSGGEKRKVRLATTLALQDLVSSRASKPIELWMGDEIDDAVDISGLERLMTVLEEKAKEKGTVLIISHNQLSDWVRQHVNVVKENGIAAVSGVLSMDEDEERI